MASCRRVLVCALVFVACESSPDAHDEPIDCDAAIVPLLPLPDSDRFIVHAARKDDAIAFVLIDDAENTRRLVLLDECGAEPRTLIDGAWDINFSEPGGPIIAQMSGAPGHRDAWILDPFGGRPTQHLSDDLYWVGVLYEGGLVVYRDDETLALPYDDDGFGDPEPYVPPMKRACEIDVDGVSYWWNERKIVTDHPPAVVFDDVDECSATKDGAVILFARVVDDEKREWAFEPATGRVVDRSSASRANMRSVLLEPRLRLLWLEEDFTTDWDLFAFATAPDGTALIAADGNLYRVAPDETELFWIAHDIGSRVSIWFDDAFYIEQRSETTSPTRRLYRVALDGTGFVDLFGGFAYEVVRLTRDRWAFSDKAGLHLRAATLPHSTLLWPDPPSELRHLNGYEAPLRNDLLFLQMDRFGHDKTIYLAQPDLIE